MSYNTKYSELYHQFVWTTHFLRLWSKKSWRYRVICTYMLQGRFLHLFELDKAIGLTPNYNMYSGKFHDQFCHIDSWEFLQLIIHLHLETKRSKRTPYQMTGFQFLELIWYAMMTHSFSSWRKVNNCVITYSFVSKSKIEFTIFLYSQIGTQ